MSDISLTSRQQKILILTEFNRSYSLTELRGLIADRVSIATLRRDLSVLVAAGFFLQLGERKATRYQLNAARQLLAPISAHRYCEIDIDSRAGNRDFNASLLESLPQSLFTQAEVDSLESATRQFRNRGEGASPTIIKKELERFVIELSWKSSKIEGNTYSLLDTELLLKEGIAATGRSPQETSMVLNHKRAFDFALTNRAEFRSPNQKVIRELHSLLVDNLGVSTGLRSRLIGITGSVYRPIQIPSQIQEALDNLLKSINDLVDPYSKALLLLAGIGYLQPFEDGNKRTSRLTTNATLMAFDCAPLSYRSVTEINYREAMLTFYERNTIVPLKEIFIQQYQFACENYLKFA